MSQQMDLFAQLNEDDRVDLIDHLSRMQNYAEQGIAVCPDVNSIAHIIRFQRHMRQWKQDTLASFAGLSLSSIQRIERGVSVSNECLDKVAIALGYKAGDFTNARIPLDLDAAAEFLEDSLKPFGGHIWIDVSPVHAQRQVRDFGMCHTYIIDAGRLEVDASADVNQLAEWLDLVAFLTCDEFRRTDRERRRIERRRLYEHVLAHVHEIELRAHAVALGGTYEARTKHPYLPKAKVALIGFFPRMTDPSALRRRQLLVPECIDVVDTTKSNARDRPPPHPSGLTTTTPP